MVSSSTAGQIAYDSIYYAKTDTTPNTLATALMGWHDVADKDWDSLTVTPTPPITGYSQKLNSISTVKMYSDSYVQDHIYFVTNDENYDTNNPNDVPTDPDTAKGMTVFNAYDLFINNMTSDKVKTPVVTDKSLSTGSSDLTAYLNPISIYSTVKSDGATPPKVTIETQTNFSADMTSFVFMSGVLSDATKGTTNNMVYIVENQHFNVSKDATIKAFDNPVFIKYTPGTTPAATYLELDPTLKTPSVLDNFLIKTISINPMTSFNDGKYDSAFLIFGGEKDNKSYMIDPVLVVATTNPDAIPIPTSTSTTANANDANSSFISKIIAFPSATPKSTDPTVATKVIPLVIFGSNMDSSNNNIALPDSGYTFTKNDQNLTGQGLLLANIHLTTTTPTDKTKTPTKTSSVVYSSTSEYKASKMVNFVDSSDNYSASAIPSFPKGYSFTASDYSKGKFTSADWNTYKTSTDKKNGNSTFVNANSKKKINPITHIVIPVIVIVVIFILLLLFMTKDIFLGKGKKNNNLSGKGKKKRQIFKLLGRRNRK